MHLRARTLVVTSLAASLLLATALPSAALDVRSSAQERVLGGLSQQSFRVDLDDGEVARGRALRFAEDAADLELRPRLAHRQVHGIQPFHSMAQEELARGAVAGINGGYWVNLRSGNPNGLSVRGNRLTTSNASAAGGGQRNRSAMGITPSGQLLLDQITTHKTLELPDASTIGIRYMNRRVHANGDINIYDDQFGDQMLIPADGLAVWIEGMELRPGGSTQGTVVRVLQPTEDRYLGVQPGQVAIVANRSAEVGTARGLRNGDHVSLSVSIAPTNGGDAWPENLEAALPGGGTILRGGQIPPLSEWRLEAFRDSHFTSRHPRTAVGRTSRGETLLVTVDGRQEDNGWSVGVTARELAQVMQQLGATDAVNLDGGGSTTMTVGGHITNRPSANGRSISSGLFVHTEPPPRARGIEEHACPSDRVPTSTFDDVPRSSVHAHAVDCLAWWGVTQGREPGVYDPSGRVTRAQMASFLARWIDGAAQRGEARALPSDAPLTFRDVAAGSTHASAIARLAEAEIVQGRSSTVYRPADRVSRDQVASFIRRTMEYATGQDLPSGRDTFIDDNGSVHEDSIDRLARLGVASGVGGFEYQPRADVRRDAMASLLMRGADHLVEVGQTQPPS